MFEFTLIIAVVAAAVSGFVTYCWLTKDRTPATASKVRKVAGSQKSNSTPTITPPRPFLNVAGAVHPRGRNLSFLRLFGLGYAPVFDLCFIPGPLAQEQLPPLVATTLQTMHAEGDAVGPDIMEFIFHRKSLTKDEVLCFALLSQSSDPGHRTVAFVDKLRFPVTA